MAGSGSELGERPGRGLVGLGRFHRFGTNAPLARAAKDTAPDAWRRGIAFMLDGLRTKGAHPLPTGPLPPQQLYQGMGNLTGTP
ncbi:hypothetical protein [Streptomyces yerevanensis]|uniref:hypothetical protein n=1 Tax=Streptomyces yerevanensis TaxID=66378 RepID=UPI000526F830|nr:hypothetical protein [Streptomyces yerevanensis]